MKKQNISAKRCGFSILFCVSIVHYAAAAVVAQCEVADGTAVTDGEGHVLAWNAPRGGAALVPAFAEFSAWTLPVLAPGGVAFGGAEEIPASPLVSEAAAVSALFLAVTPAPATNRFSTLVEAPGTSVTAVPHVAPQTYDPEDAAGISVRVNGGLSLAFPAAPHIVEVDFPQPVPGADLRIGGVSACAAWNQAWRGGVGAVVVFDTPPDEAVREVVRSYLARRHGIAGGFPPPGRGAVLRAMSQGLDTHGLFSTTLILK
jgi:hypothetical protein